MHDDTKKPRIPLIILIASFASLAVCSLFTSPFGHVVNILIFFIALFIFIVSLCWTIALMGRETISSKSKFKIAVFSLTVIVILMFRSAQSLSMEDALILLLIALGALFYGTKRTA
jgi:hypothetical protein